MIILKNAQASDLYIIRALMRASKAYWGYDDKFLDRFMDIIGINTEYLLKQNIKLVYINDTLIGFYNFIIHSDDTFELDNFFLHPDYIGKGFGRKMWQICCKTARELGKNEFIIWSDPNAELFYTKMGCEKIGVKKSPMIPNRFPPVLKFKLMI